MDARRGFLKKQFQFRDPQVFRVQLSPLFNLPWLMILAKGVYAIIIANIV
jgi:hypothetical protein